MPVMTGEEALPLIKSIRPDIPVIISSGFSEAEISLRFADSDIAGVLPKPYTVAGLISRVSEALESNAVVSGH
jgi:two-component system cell cycle sensor histidine kinase/response regulator CckA